MKILICGTLDQALARDVQICASLRSEDGNKGSRWSGAYTDGSRFGIIWASEVAAVVGDPDQDSSIIVVDDIEGHFKEVPAPAPQPDNSLP